MRLAWLCAAFVLIGCAPAGASSSGGAAPAATHGAGGRQHTHPRWAIPELKQVHDVIDPLWHDTAPKGDVAAACAAVADLKKSVASLEQARLPDDLAARKVAFDGAVANLKTKVEQLENKCANRGGGPFDVKAEVALVHDAFHSVMDRLR